MYGQWYSMNAMISANRFQTDSDKEANLLMGDAINNFKTVQNVDVSDLFIFSAQSSASLILLPIYDSV